MKAIEQRAIEYAKGRWDELTAKEAYIAGATDQKAIDDAEKHYKKGYRDAVKEACDWLKKELQELAMDEVKDNFLENDFKVILKSQVPDWLRDFRKAMER